MLNAPTIKTNYNNLNKLWLYLSIRRRSQFSLVLVLMIFASFAEILSIGAVLPFLGVLTTPEIIFENSHIQPIIELFDINSPDQLILPVTIFFIVITIIAALTRLIMLYAITRLSFTTGSDLSVEIYRRTLFQKYTVHVSRNSSEIINAIVQKINTVIYDVINAILVLISSVILIFGILFAIFLVDTSAAIFSIISFSLIYLLIIKYTKNTLNKNSITVAQESTNMIKALQEGLGGIRDVLIDGTQNAYCKIYAKADIQYRVAQGINRFIGISPRYVIEALGMILIVILAYFVSQRSTGIIGAIPLLGALALGAQRLLPVAQQAYTAVTTIAGAHSSFEDVLELLDQELPDYIDEPTPSHIIFNRNITMKNIDFRYSKDTPWVIKNVNLVIEKGSRVGFVGQTGCGKSTMLDILMGLLTPIDGSLLIDGNKLENGLDYRGWQRHIAHVPQFIYLSDGTIEENIVLSATDKIVDREKLQRSISQAQLTDLIDSWPLKLNTIIGENGVKLSGGQRQRIGIARALYKNANVLILDEATSALDNSTEKDIMNAINSIDDDITIMIIAHRTSTLKKCDQIFQVNSKNGVKIVLYDDLLN